MNSFYDNSNSEPLTTDKLKDSFDTIFRDFGQWGKHSKKCVYLNDNKGVTRWCCEKDCQMGKQLLNGN